MLQDIVTRILETAPDMRVLSQSMSDDELVTAAAESNIDVTILGCEEGELPELGCRLLNARPGIKILGLASDGRRSYVYELRPRSVPLGEVSPQGLLEAVRDVAGRPQVGC